MTEKEIFIKVKGEKFAFKAININKSNDFVEFDRVNSKTGLVTGHMSINKNEVVSIEERNPAVAL